MMVARRPLFACAALTFGVLGVLSPLGGCEPALPPPPTAPTVARAESPTAVPRQLLRGTKPASTAVLKDNDVLVPLDEATTWIAWVDLAEGTNAFGLRAADAAGQTSGRVPVEIILDTEPPLAPTVDALPAFTAAESVVVAGQRTPGDRVVVNGTVLPGDVVAAFSVALPLSVGPNPVRVASLDAAGNESSVVDAVVVVDRDAPALALTAPLTGAIAGALVTVAGTASDGSPGLAVEVCAGSCVDDTDFVPATVDAGTFTGSLDLTLRTVLLDGGPVDIIARARDLAGNTTTATTSVFLAREPVVIDDVPSNAVALELAGTATGGAALAWANSRGEVGVSVDAADDAFAPATDTLATGVGPAATVAVALGADLHVAWLAGSAFHEKVAADSAPAILVDGAADPVTALDLAALADGTPVAAFVQAGVVRLSIGDTGGTGFGAPVDVSDATTVAPAAVALVVGAGDVVTVVWTETSDRDGISDDADVVARRVDARAAPSPAPLTAVLLVSADAGAFVDGASGPAAAAALGGAGAPVAVAWVDDATARLAVIDDDAFAAGTVAEPVAVSSVAGAGAASAVSIAADGDRVVVGWLDDGEELLDGAAAPGLVVRAGAPDALGAHRVLSRGAAASPSLTLAGSPAGTVIHAAWLEAGDVLFFAVELP